MVSFPRKIDDIEINEVDDGYVVYHRDRDRVHYLNHTAALVLEFCTGENDAEAIPDILKRAYELETEPIGEVEECLTKLYEEGLVT
jgi:hypothetical protein